MREPQETSRAKHTPGPEFVMEPVLHPPTGQPVRHLPGPWTCEGPDMFGDFNILPPGDCAAVAAVVSNMRPPEIVEGNARLIAASPKMLEALREAEGELYTVPARDKEQERVLAVVRAAIAKATGA